MQRSVETRGEISYLIHHPKLDSFIYFLSYLQARAIWNRLEILSSVRLLLHAEIFITHYVSLFMERIMFIEVHRSTIAFLTSHIRHRQKHQKAWSWAIRGKKMCLYILSHES